MLSTLTTHHSLWESDKTGKKSVRNTLEQDEAGPVMLPAAVHHPHLSLVINKILAIP